MKQRHLLLVDGTNIFRTCYEANPAPDSVSKAEGALRSTVGSIFKGIKRHEPTHVYVAFDVPNHKTWRNEVYAGYKGSRRATPQEVVDIIPQVMDALGAKNVFTDQRGGYEAEDLLARVGRTWVSKTEDPVTVLSTDKDLTLLVQEGILVHTHFTDTWRDAVWIQETYGVAANALLDYFSLVGDTVDDIPGVSGVGPKTAAKLVNEFGSLDAILAAAKSGDIAFKSVTAKLVASEKSALVSRELLRFRSPEDMNLTFAKLKFG